MKFSEMFPEVQELFEMPQNVYPTEFDLTTPTKNKHFVDQFFATKKAVAIKQYGDYTLYEAPRAYALIDNDTKQVVYAVRFTLQNNTFIGHQCAQQVMVWRNTKVFETEGLAKEIFFNSLLQHYKVMITDSMQTEDGQRFWDKRILEALRMGLNVYYISLIPPREITKINNDREYQALASSKEIWGNDNKHQARRLVISSVPLSIRYKHMVS
jgi:hypothetical protein